jgi:hypothetical protein
MRKFQRNRYNPPFPVCKLYEFRAGILFFGVLCMQNSTDYPMFISFFASQIRLSFSPICGIITSTATFPAVSRETQKYISRSEIQIYGTLHPTRTRARKAAPQTEIPVRADCPLSDFSGKIRKKCGQWRYLLSAQDEAIPDAAQSATRLP